VIPEKQNMISSIKLSVGDPHFFPRVFTLACKNRKETHSKDGDNFKRVCAEEYDDLSKRLDKTRIQESTSVRNVLRTRRLANLLITDKGELNSALLPKVITHLSAHLYSIGPNRQYDSKRQEHILKVLKTLQTDKEIVRLLKNIGKPYSHKYADQIIRDTLQLPPNTIITDAHARRAVLSAWMCYLRQNVGSCFATAPAILIHAEQPQQFFADINELLGTGRLKRTFGGIEYSVPLSTSWGAGDLKKLFYLSRDRESDQMELWLSPGMNAALESANIISAELPLKEKIEENKRLIQNAIHHWQGKQSYILTSAEEVIRHIFLIHYNLTKKDIIDFENRPRGMVHGGLLMQVSSSNSSMGGKGQAILNFQTQLEIAENAFKGLADNALLKAWEFTVASFSETKSNFTRWNLYSALGLGAEESGGIGHCIYEIVKEKVDKANRKVQDLQLEYEQIYSQVKYLESRYKGASTEQEAKWIKVEYQSKANEFYLFEELRDKENDKARRIANLFNNVIALYDEIFPKYFQEVYDADMHDIGSSQYDDSPAGFRLLYKHGRSNTAQWQPIKTPNEYIDALVSFFTMSESEISGSEELQGMHEEFGQIVTAIVNHVKTKEFLETSFYRMGAAHNTRVVKNPLENLDKIEKKPWVYTSGGTMTTLVSCYWRREQKPTEVSRWVESPIELAVFLIDSIKQLPGKNSEELLKAPSNALLMHSPTHAFLFKPAISPFKKGVESDVFTYTWVRDQIAKPMEKFWSNITLNDETMQFIVDQLAELIPIEVRFYFQRMFSNMRGSMNLQEFRDHIIHTIRMEKGLKFGGREVLSAMEIDSSLYSLLPLTPFYDLKEKLQNIFSNLKEVPEKITAQAMAIFDELSGNPRQSNWISSQGLQSIAKALLCLSMEATSLPFDCHLRISKIAQDLGYAPPAALIFADSNWVKDEFAFVVNPGTGKLEVWRIDYTSSVGAPMSNWEQWLNGSRKDINWGIYSRSYEYS
jgi:hypothetical protein